MGIDHAGIEVPTDSYPQSLKLYQEALKPLGYEVLMQFGPTITGMGSSDDAIAGYTRADFWLTGSSSTPNTKTHVAFKAKSEHSLQLYLGLRLFMRADCE